MDWSYNHQPALTAELIFFYRCSNMSRDRSCSLLKFKPMNALNLNLSTDRRLWSVYGTHTAFIPWASYKSNLSMHPSLPPSPPPPLIFVWPCGPWVFLRPRSPLFPPDYLTLPFPRTLSLLICDLCILLCIFILLSLFCFWRSHIKCLKRRNDLLPLLLLLLLLVRHALGVLI